MSYEERLRRLRLPILSYRRYRGDMIDVFKITHGLYDGDVTAGFLLAQGDSKTRGHKCSFLKAKGRGPMEQSARLGGASWDSTIFRIQAELWKESGVMYGHDCDVKLLTSSRNLRYTNTYEQPENDDIICDLMSEA